MTKYRFKTKEEFKADGRWKDYTSLGVSRPAGWNNRGEMNQFMGQDIPDEYIEKIEGSDHFSYSNWSFQSDDCILNELSEEEEQQLFNQIKNSLITKKKMEKQVVKTETKEVVNSVREKFVFMDKTVNILNVGFDTCKNVILYGPGE
jgi:hypothetical protein